MQEEVVTTGWSTCKLSRLLGRLPGHVQLDKICVEIYLAGNKKASKTYILLAFELFSNPKCREDRIICRDGKIRTCDLLVPNQARWPDYATPRTRLLFQVTSIVFEVVFSLFWGCKDSYLFHFCKPFEKIFAERAGFEPAVQLPVRQFSKLVVSASHPSLQYSYKERVWGLPKTGAKLINASFYQRIFPKKK